ncbi:hypothetical protein PRIPAC_89513 [Pristionchus pacificus]|uniref:Uncharacterized protein n=1 Tax=Pristionchus pacificus TaxID=54126 RepID=A0A2A6B6Y9_PRIPA|nr:hypothetical protein PRIPAC_89513 [Pristionchus pacificus]|eukprot:PDM61613.1 hypothetical protein PRIPAC_51055 [Pristionchus pacificus]
MDDSNQVFSVLSSTQWTLSIFTYSSIQSSFYIKSPRIDLRENKTEKGWDLTIDGEIYNNFDCARSHIIIRTEMDVRSLAQHSDDTVDRARGLSSGKAESGSDCRWKCCPSPRPSNMAARPLVTVYSDKNEATQTRIKLPAVFRAPIRSDVVCFMHDQVTRLLLNPGEPVVPSLVFLVFAVAERTAQDREHSVTCVSIARRMWPGGPGVAEIPFVVSDKVEIFRKTKEAVSFLHRANLWDDVEKVYNSKKIRAGISRNRRFKQKLGPTIVYGKDSGVKQEPIN